MGKSWGKDRKGEWLSLRADCTESCQKKASVRAAARDKSPPAEHFLVGGWGSVLDCDNLKMALLTALQCIVCHLLRHC